MGTPPPRFGRVDDSDTAEQFEVERLVAHRQCLNGREFLVKWAGTDPSGNPYDDSWIVEDWIPDHLIAVYRTSASC